MDDPTSAAQALSDAERNNANDWFDQTLRSRLNDPATGAMVVIMQRLHEQDLTGYLLETEPGVWEHLRVPLVEEEQSASHEQHATSRSHGWTRSTWMGNQRPRKPQGRRRTPAQQPRGWPTLRPEAAVQLPPRKPRSGGESSGRP